MFGPGLFRLLLALLVVIHHTFPLRMGAFSVYVFFTLSGYWIARMWESKYSKTTSPYLTFLISRWWRLFPVFFFCLLIGGISESALAGHIPNYQMTAYWWIRQLPIVGSASIKRILRPTWSIDVEMQFYIVAPLLIVMSRRWNALLTWILLVCSTAWFVWGLNRGASPETPYGWLYLAFFLAGILLYRTGWSANKQVAWGAVLLFLVISAGLLAYQPTRHCLWIRGLLDHGESFPKAIQMGRWLCPIGGAFLILPFVSWNVRQRSNSFDRELGNLSYPLYLFHWVSGEWYYHFVDWTLPAWRNGLLLVTAVASSLVGAWLILRCIDRPAEAMRVKWVNARLASAHNKRTMQAGVASLKQIV